VTKLPAVSHREGDRALERVASFVLDGVCGGHTLLAN
jgi:uncharacterized protein YoaH (UPF0181 family)